MRKVKGDGRRGVVGKIVSPPKRIFAEVDRFIDAGERQILGKRLKISLDRKKQEEIRKKTEKERIKQIETTLRKLAEWQEKERRRILAERKRATEIREKALEEKKRQSEGRLNPVAWVGEVGKTIWERVFHRQRREIKPAGFRG